MTSEITLERSSEILENPKSKSKFVLAAVQRAKDYLKPTKFKIWVLIATVAGLAGRIIFVALAKWHQAVWNDGGWYHCEAQTFVQGNGFKQIAVFMSDNGAHIGCVATSHPTAAHPPLWTLFLAVADIFHFQTLGTQLILNCMLGALAIPIMAMIGKRVAGYAAGVLTAFFVAAYPGGWVETGQLTSETLGLVTACLVILGTYRLVERPSVQRAIVLGLWCALAALTRSELVLSVVLICALIVGFRPFLKITLKDRLVLAGTLIISTVLIMSPWLIRNNLVFSNPTFTSTELGFTLDMANCNDTYFAPPNASISIKSTSFEGYWTLICSLPQPSSGDESYDNTYYTNHALTYIKANLGRVPTIMTMRVLRLWQGFDPIGQVRLDFESEQWNYPANLAKMISFYAMIPFIVIAFRRLRKSSILSFPLYIFPIIATISVAFITEDPRYRVMSEGGICLLAAIGVLAFIDSKRPNRTQLLQLSPKLNFAEGSEIKLALPRLNLESSEKDAKKYDINSRKTWWVSFGSILAILLVGSISLPTLSGPDEPAAVIHAAGAARGQLVGTPVRDPNHNNTFSYSPLTSVRLPHTFDQIESFANCYAMASNENASCARFYGTSAPGLGSEVTYQGRYPPWYFALDGIFSYVMLGSPTLYMMRFFSDVLSAAFIASAIQAILEKKGKKQYALLGMLFALTPTFLMLQMVVGSSGFESAAAICFWAGGARLLSDFDSAGIRQIRRVGISLCCLVLARPDSPLWAGIATIVLFLFFMKKGLIRQLWIDKRVRFWTAMGIVSTVATLVWDKLEQATNVLGYTYPPPYDWNAIFHYTFNRSLIYVAEQIGAYGEYDPNFIIIGLVALLLLFIAFVIATTSRYRKALLGLYTVCAWAAAVIGSALIFPRAGFIWQGRYSLPIALGLPIISGFVAGEKIPKLESFNRFVEWSSKRASMLRISLTVGVLIFLDIYLIEYVFSAGPTTGINLGDIMAPPWEAPLTTLGSMVLLLITILSFSYVIYRHMADLDPIPTKLKSALSKLRSQPEVVTNNSDDH